MAQHWAAKVDSLDGFIFVTAKYNRAPTAALKNALDHAYREFKRKPAAYVGYGGVGAARAIEQLRLINIELQMAPTRTGVYIGGADFMGLWRGDDHSTRCHIWPSRLKRCSTSSPGGLRP